MKITLVQSRGLVNDPQVNFFKARMRINNVESEIFVFPEMFASGYISNEDDMKLDMLQSKLIDNIAKLSDNKGSTIILGCPRKVDGRICDSALILDGKEESWYDKINLNKKGGVFDETAVFSPGKTPMIVTRQGLNMGIAVGHDLFMSELVEYYSKNGADMIICISALLPEEITEFIMVAQSAAIRFSIPIMVCNMTGPDCGKELGGKSVFIDEKGTLVETCTAGSDVREIRIDVKALNGNTAARIFPTKMEFSGCDRVEIKCTEADPNGPFCPFSGN